MTTAECVFAAEIHNQPGLHPLFDRGAYLHAIGSPSSVLLSSQKHHHDGYFR